MSEQDLRDLDKELADGMISEDDYMSHLRDEVLALHSEYDETAVSNMIKMQLRSLAIEEDLVEDLKRIETHDFYRIHPVRQDRNDCSTGAKSQSMTSKELEAHEEEKNIGQQPLKPQAQNNSKEGQKQNQSQHQCQSQQKESQEQDKTNSDDCNNRCSSKGENDKNQNSGGGSNRWWMTWQIVPEWAIFGQESNETTSHQEYDRNS